MNKYQDFEIVPQDEKRLKKEKNSLEAEISYIPTKSKSINKSYSYDDLMHALAYGHDYGRKNLSHDLALKDYKKCMNFKN